MPWAVDAENPHLFQGAYVVVLNSGVEIRFVPDVSHFAPPWNAHRFEGNDPIASSTQAFLWSLRTSEYSVTPNLELVGGEEEVALLPYEPADPDDPNIGIVWYVDTEEWTGLEAELADLSERTDQYDDFVRLSELEETHLGKFLNERFLSSSHLTHFTLEALGRAN